MMYVFCVCHLGSFPIVQTFLSLNSCSSFCIHKIEILVYLKGFKVEMYLFKIVKKLYSGIKIPQTFVFVWGSACWQVCGV